MRVTIEKLAPTGEGVVRSGEGVGFVAGALPGEEVEAEVDQRRKTFWKGRVLEVVRPSQARVGGPHASCAGCDWAYFEPAAALKAKRALFLETMERIGGQRPDVFGTLAAEPSPPRYRLRNRFHVSGRGASAVMGYFTPRTHSVEPITDCEAVSRETIALLPRIREAIAESGTRVSTLELLESSDSSQTLARLVLEPSHDGAAADATAGISPLVSGLRLEQTYRGIVSESGTSSLALAAGGRCFSVSVGTFFQANRYLVSRLYEEVRELARSVAPGRALDAFGGAGLFAGALLDAGHEVTTVEGSLSAIRDAQRTRAGWADGSQWNIVRSKVARFIAGRPRLFDLAVVDPPRTGLGADLAALIAERIASRLVYVSCEPATLARDLRAILGRNFHVVAARLYDLFAGTHRVEAVVVLGRGSRS